MYYFKLYSLFSSIKDLIRILVLYKYHMYFQVLVWYIHILPIYFPKNFLISSM